MRRRTIITVGSLIILVLAGLYVSRLFNRSNIGYIEPSDAAVVQPSTDIFDMTPRHIDGTYVTFNIPKGMDTLTSSPLANPILESFNYSYHDSSVAWRVSITVNDISRSPAGSDSSYQFRLTQPRRYVASLQSYGGQPFTMMTDTMSGGSSVVAYSVNGSMEADIAVTGNGEVLPSTMSSIYRVILSSWSWR